MLSRNTSTISSIHMIWVLPTHSTSIKCNAGSSLIFLRNDVLIFNGKENQEAGAICFDFRKSFGNSHQKVMQVILLWKKNAGNQK